MNAPYKPEVTGATDTSNFDVDDAEVKHTVSDRLSFNACLL